MALKYNFYDNIFTEYSPSDSPKKVILKYGGELIEEVSGVLTAQKYRIKRG